MSDREKNNENVSEEKIIKIRPSEIGTWEYCHLKWYFQQMANNKKRINTDTESGSEKK
ncbi:MAG: hypothetical protein BWY26_01447 [Elusimicrobia bacterium ADurb.Bin231]|nr:MAG: hypothetical protein BWY26_01447 [Elusimicrobia bacterium ADurb.Bin231]